jgi:PAS domain S-box-containing protein
MVQALLKEADAMSYAHQHEYAPVISSDISGYRDYRGVPVFGAWTWNPHLGLGIATEIDVEEAMGGYYSLRRNLVIITGLTMVIAVAAVIITLLLASRATSVMRRTHNDLEQLVESRTAELAESEEKYRRLFELSQDPMWLIVGDKLIMANDAAARILELKSTEPLTNTHPSLLSPERQPDGQRSDLKANQMLTTAYREGYHRFEWVHQRKKGVQFPVEVSLTKIKYQGKDALFCIWRDISEQKAYEEKLKQATLEAQQANRAKSEFLSSMSHELRTPLNAILGFSQLLESEENLNAEQKENVTDIIRAGSHLLDLINEVLDLAKIESGKLELSIEPVPLNDIMSACQKLITPTAEQHGIRLQFAEGCMAGHRLRADYTRTKQVLLNLLSNAIKYNRENGSVTIHCQQQDDKLRIEVRDTGTGIPAAKQDKLFEAFNRLGAESGSIEGTGIGLLITRQLVEMMGGELGVESNLGEGSTFWFTLPWLEQQSASPAVSPPQPQQADKALHLTGRQRVLYIEDNPVNLKLVEKLIAKQTELELISAEEPIAGIELAISEKPDLILLDINLPTMNGYEVAEKLRAMAETKAIPIIALTANAMADDVAKGEEAGFDDYLTKPIQITAFLEVLRRYLDA